MILCKNTCFLHFQQNSLFPAKLFLTHQNSKHFSSNLFACSSPLKSIKSFSLESKSFVTHRFMEASMKFRLVRIAYCLKATSSFSKAFGNTFWHGTRCSRWHMIRLCIDAMLCWNRIIHISDYSTNPYTRSQPCIISMHKRIMCHREHRVPYKKVFPKALGEWRCCFEIVCDTRKPELHWSFHESMCNKAFAFQVKAFNAFERWRACK